MNTTQQAALSSLVAGVAAGAAHFFFFATPQSLVSLLLLASGIFFLALAGSLWACGQLDDRIAVLEQRLNDWESRSGAKTPRGD